MSEELYPCPACNGRVAYDAETCPHCGKKLQEGCISQLLSSLWWGFAILVVISLFKRYC